MKNVVNRALVAKKKTLLVLMLSMATIAGMAQGRHPGHRESDRGHGRDHRQEQRYTRCATPEQMQMVMAVLENQSFDDKKLEVAKLCVNLGHFCVSDLAQIAGKFSFDDNRKKFLIYAYAYCEDPQNYYMLKESFSFRSNFDEMMETVMPGYKR